MSKQQTTAIQRNDPQDLAGLLKRMAPAMAAALPKHASPDRMARIALTALRTNKDLANCTPGSFLAAIMQSAQLGLEVNTSLGHAYLIPFKRECQLIIGYQGMLDLARRSGQVSAIYAFPVYQGDVFHFELGLEPKLRHVPDDGGKPHTPQTLTHVYAVAKLKDGEPIFTVLTKAEVERYRDRSRAKNSGPWVTDYEAMALKTSVRRLFRWLPKSAEMAVAAELDEAPEIGKPQPIDEDVLTILQEHGVDAAAFETSAEDSPAPTAPEQDGRRIKLGKRHDSDTGEVAPEDEPPHREPGED